MAVEHRYVGGIIAGSLPSGPHTAETGTAAAADRQQEQETGLRLQC